MIVILNQNVSAFPLIKAENRHTAIDEYRFDVITHIAIDRQQTGKSHDTMSTIFLTISNFIQNFVLPTLQMTKDFSVCMVDFLWFIVTTDEINNGGASD